jgi:glycosyltransferase involved in cell wall biosynthesis
MRILMLDNEFPPLGGGTGVVNEHLLKELTAYPDIEVDLVTSSRTPRNYETVRFAERITIYKAPVDNRNIHHSTNVELLRYAWRGLQVSRRLLAQHHYDLSFAFAGVPAGVLSWMLKLTHDLPYLVSLQGPDVPGFEARYNYLYPVLTPLLRVIWSQAAVVTAISQDHQRLAQRTLPTLPIPIIYNGVDIETFGATPIARKDGAVNVLCVGRLIERKGQQHLLRAFAQLRAQVHQSLRLTLAGTGDAEASLRALARELGIADLVTFMGFVSREDMPAVYRQADIFALPSQNEGMSIALLEAMASGLPVVVTATGGTAELVTEGVNGCIVPWADVSALTTALARLARDAESRQRMGQANRQHVQRFSWPHITQEYLQWCEWIVRETPSRKRSTDYALERSVS